MRLGPRRVGLLLTMLSAAAAHGAVVRSPDGRIEVTVDVGERGVPQYSVSYRGVGIMPPGALGLRFRAQPAFDRGFRVAGSSSSGHDSTWEQPWGERRLMRDRHNELVVQFASAEGPPRRFDLRVRVFDDGFGFRYEVPVQPGYGAVDITEELTEFRLEDDPKTKA